MLFASLNHKTIKEKNHPKDFNSFCQGRHLKVWQHEVRWGTDPLPWKSSLGVLLLTLWCLHIRNNLLAHVRCIFHGSYALSYASGFWFLFQRLLDLILNILQLSIQWHCTLPAGTLAEETPRLGVINNFKLPHGRWVLSYVKKWPRFSSSIKKFHWSQWRVRKLGKWNEAMSGRYSL